MCRVLRYDASRQTLAYKRESLGDAQYQTPNEFRTLVSEPSVYLGKSGLWTLHASTAPL